MTSHAALAQAANTAAPPFNGLFYATAATIIPVLFLAIAVQGRGYQNLINALADIDRRRTSSPRGDWKPIPLTAASFVLFSAAALIVVYGVASEIFAIYALYQQQARSSTGQTVLTGLIILTIATAAGPALTFLGYNYRYIRDAAKPPPENTTPNANTKPEPDKPDP
jgi:hypothetical protein